ncbi:putative ABC transporter, membrane protein [Nocardia nova SH22a]|uniref:Putative ABC transporter, membrane protein n=1 Tax=Nocardia nova SH22a TaxID=1415166 RepID=W5TF21_9NOCA|nr:ABC transporter permease [Nocardia nova]AHH17827.1 putative ABC transporter, membrane protein [Nocardia nova SH22a]
MRATEYLRTGLWKTIQALITIVVVYIVVFVIVTVIPGDPITNRLRDPQNGYSTEQIDALLAYYRLDRPVAEQLWYSLVRFAHGDLGLSLASTRPVSGIYLHAAGSTVILSVLALTFALLLAAAIAVGAQYLPRRYGGDLLRSLPSLFLSLPNFLIGLLLIDLFAFRLGWFDITGYRGVSAAIPAAIALAIPVSSQITQVFIQSLDSVRHEPYAIVAEAKGLSAPYIFFRHLLRPAALPTLTVIGVTAGEVIGGAVITETIFGRTGIGSVIEKAVTNKDVPVLQGGVVLAAVVFLVINLIVDLTYPLLDPRLRRTARRIRRAQPGSIPATEGATP